MWMQMRMRTNMLIVVVVVATLTSMSDCAPASDRRQDAEADERISFAVQYLQQYGYLSKVQNVFTEDEFSNALDLLSCKDVLCAGMHPLLGFLSDRLFNQNSGVASLRGPGQSLLDDVTFSKMKEPRCGVADIQRDEFQNPQLALNGVAEIVNLRDRWFKCEVTWRVLAGDNRRSDDELRLRAARDDEETADINLGFFRRYHGDPVPFDGSGGTYAHAFFPVSGGNLRGRIHFDRDEDWNVNGFPGRVMNYTMLHELGHTLGLYHSSTRNSVMYAFLTGSARFKEGLQDDDMRRINMLYDDNFDVEVPNARLPKESVPTRRPAPRIPTSPRRRITPVRSLEPTDDNAPGATLPKPRSTLSNTDVDQRPTFYKIHCYTGHCVKKFYRG
ncbi:PREDICTED: stromelysin-3-like [Priapulus caudatus]|uniref:Stromelysin-3-like n=1 Tax=Priapulus caudatus TaxID=37621 RepID=A0ABM1ENR4_PRICU|nr:PREDICTED: stromelysin-3-like [Priapulus caudatus]